MAQVISLFVERKDQCVLSECFSFEHFSFEILQMLLGDHYLLFLVVDRLRFGQWRVESSLLFGFPFLLCLRRVQIVYFPRNSLAAWHWLGVLLHWLDWVRGDHDMPGGSKLRRSCVCSCLFLALSDRRFALMAFRATTFVHIVTFIIWVNHIFSTLFSLIWTYRVLEAQHLKLAIKLRHQLLRVERRRAGTLLLLIIVNEYSFHSMTFAFLFQIQPAPGSSVLLTTWSAAFTILVLPDGRIGLAAVGRFGSSGISFGLRGLPRFNPMNVIEYLCFIFLQYFLYLGHNRALILLWSADRLDVLVRGRLAILRLIIIHCSPASRRSSRGALAGPLFVALPLDHGVRIRAKISDVLTTRLAVSAGRMISSTTSVSSRWWIFTLLTWIEVI